MSHARWFPGTAWWKSGITSYPFHVHWNATNMLTSLSSRWLPMNFVATCTDTQPSLTHTVLMQTYLYHIFLQRAISNTNLEAKLGKTLLRVCKEVEKRETEKDKRGRSIWSCSDLSKSLLPWRKGPPCLACSHSKVLVPCEGKKDSLNCTGCLGVFFF